MKGFTKAGGILFTRVATKFKCLHYDLHKINILGQVGKEPYFLVILTFFPVPAAFKIFVYVFCFLAGTTILAFL